MFLNEEEDVPLGVLFCRPPLPVRRVGVDVDVVLTRFSIELGSWGTLVRRAALILAAILLAEVNSE